MTEYDEEVSTNDDALQASRKSDTEWYRSCATEAPKAGSMDLSSEDVGDPGPQLPSAVADQVGAFNAGSKQFACCNVTALHNQIRAAEEPEYGFQIFPVDLDYRGRFSLIAGFEKHIRYYGHDTTLNADDYVISYEWLQRLQGCLMLPPDFDAPGFFNECVACYKWLTELGIDPETGLDTDEIDSVVTTTHKTTSPTATRGLRSSTHSTTLNPCRVHYSSTQTVQTPSHRDPPERYHQLATLGGAFAQPPSAQSVPYASLRWKAPLTPANSVPSPPLSDTKVVIPRIVTSAALSSYPGLVYINGFSFGAPQEGQRGFGKSGSLKELHTDAPPREFDIRVLNSLQLSIDELCAFFPLHYTWHPFLERLLGAGWLAVLTARLMSYYRGYTDGTRTNALRLRVQKQFTHITNSNPATDFSTGSWELKLGAGTDKITESTMKSLFGDYKLLDLTKGVVHLPKGMGRRHLTIAVEHAQAHDNMELMLSELSDYIKNHGIGKHLQNMATYIQYPDVAAHEFFQSAVDTAGPVQGNARRYKAGFQAVTGP